MKGITISAVDLRVLLDVAEGYAAEHGLDSVSRYATPAAVERAVANASEVIREATNHARIG